MNVPKCPKCGKETKKELKTWMLGEKTKVTRYECACGNRFNTYENIAPKEEKEAEAPTETTT